MNDEEHNFLYLSFSSFNIMATLTSLQQLRKCSLKYVCKNGIIYFIFLKKF